MSVTFKSENVQKYKPLADSIKEGLEVQGNTLKEKESHSAYFANLPEGITKKEVEDLSKYNAKFITSAHVAVGEIAADLFQKDSSLSQIDASVGFFGKTDTIDMSVNRTRTYQNHLAENEADKEIVKHLVIKATVSTQSAKGYGVKSVKESMSEEFQGMFNK